jgi:hypothetical protein
VTKLTASNANLARSKDLKRKEANIHSYFIWWKNLLIEHHPIWPLSHVLDQIAAITMI